MTVDIPTCNKILYYFFGQSQMWAINIWMDLCNISMLMPEIHCSSLTRLSQMSLETKLQQILPIDMLLVRPHIVSETAQLNYLII